MEIKLIPDIEEVIENLGIPGIAAVILLPVFIPAVTGVGKPIAKATIKGGILLYEKSKGVIAEVGETLEDLIAEAKAEIAEAQAQAVEREEEAIAV